MFTKEWSREQEVTSKLAIVKEAFSRKKEILCSRMNWSALKVIPLVEKVDEYNNMLRECVLCLGKDSEPKACLLYTSRCV